MAVAKPRCSEITCFQYNEGKCELLNKRIKGDCPFNQTKQAVNEGRRKAHQKLVNEGRFDLIEIYERNDQRGEQW